MSRLNSSYTAATEVNTSVSTEDEIGLFNQIKYKLNRRLSEIKLEVTVAHPLESLTATPLHFASSSQLLTEIHFLVSRKDCELHAMKLVLLDKDSLITQLCVSAVMSDSCPNRLRHATAEL
jgi:hypothetical protein